jgi:DNA-binding transcriptional regulator GbsR (MarR family)
MKEIKLNFTQIPNWYFDKLQCRLSDSENKVYLQILRKTLGWHKETDSISQSQLVQSTGLSRNSVKIGLKGILNAGLVQVSKNSTSKIATQYRVRLYEFTDEELDRIFGCQNLTVKNSPSRESKSDSQNGFRGSKSDPTKENNINKIKEIESTKSSLSTNRDEINKNESGVYSEINSIMQELVQLFKLNNSHIDPTDYREQNAISKLMQIENTNVLELSKKVFEIIKPNGSYFVGYSAWSAKPTFIYNNLDKIKSVQPIKGKERQKIDISIIQKMGLDSKYIDAEGYLR